VAALASWLDARTHGGNWLIRIENVDAQRERSGAAENQLAQLARFGLISDEPVVMQSDREELYRIALDKLRAQGRTFYCRCTRAQLSAEAPSASERAYPGTCRDRALGPPGAIRFRAEDGEIEFVDRACGNFRQDVAREVGDFILRRSDGLWAYQLAVVVDDAEQGITDVVRGADLLDNTPRQILLQRALQLPTPRYLHVPVVLGADERKLSKHDASQPLGSRDPLRELEQAWAHLGFEPSGAASAARFLEAAIEAWRRRHGPATEGAALPARRAAAADAP
jgi:glutamyl-Q tRNA(Asp) synthetase